MNAVELVAALRDLYRGRPETRHLQAWELPWMLYALNYSDELEDEAEIAAAIEVASGDHPGWRPAA